MTEKKSAPVDAKKIAAAKAKGMAAKAALKAEVAVEAETYGKKKSSIHPRFREITVVMTNGTTFKTRSTYGNDTLKLDIDITTHPAWTNESNFVNLKADKVTAFTNKYQGLSFIKA